MSCSTDSGVRQLLLSAQQSVFTDFSASASPTTMLSHFSTMSEPIIEHAPMGCPMASLSHLKGSNAVRSYFDILATNWRHSDIDVYSVDVDAAHRSVSVCASITWTWRSSGHRFREDFVSNLQFDEHLKLQSFVIKTLPGSECVMRAKDPAEAA
ncbi:hypothetical protein FISHEDRAFT_70766 [Fistulina hepatica ATCC 64428]|uniref:SnoaL-like domain-containing protein n=1 Tax=Fistulina hepatica ATCC 64428 TaxID=1128425 RepID=A0A0D7AJR2_9AGAR|nr:hypothetical protein FISHEDRAFT_70766 [Fistulina hepatica ATCC 64428]